MFRKAVLPSMKTHSAPLIFLWNEIILVTNIQDGGCKLSCLTRFLVLLLTMIHVFSKTGEFELQEAYFRIPLS